jgi:hypothetical protein
MDDPPPADASGGGGATVNVHAGAALCVTFTDWFAMVIDTIRSPPGFAPAVAVTVPLPVPPAVESISHVTPPFTAAVHAQDGGLAVTLNEPGPPPEGSVTAGGETMNVHGAGAASCVTVNVRPAIVSVPVRAVMSVFGATVKPTELLPRPDPLPSVIHPAPDEADHVQASALAVTGTDPLPPDEPNAWGPGGIEYEHPEPCDTVSIWPAIDALPLRAGPGFAATLSVTDPPPGSLRTDAIVTQSTVDVAVQPQLLPVASATETLIVPPPTGELWLVGLIVKLHEAAACVTVNM